MGCGNTNISLRLSSPGNEPGVSQTAAAGPCGQNTNISIRINSPGNNGPVTQSVGSTGTNPYVGIDPAALPARLDGSAKKFAQALVAQAQARVNRTLRQTLPRRAPERSRSTTRVRVQSTARSSVAGGKVTASARVTIRTSVRTRPAQGTAKRRADKTSAADEAPPSRTDRLAASPRAGFPEARGAGGSDSRVAAIVLALLAALAVAYLLVPPLRPARAIGRSLLRWSKGGTPQR